MRADYIYYNGKYDDDREKIFKSAHSDINVSRSGSQKELLEELKKWCEDNAQSEKRLVLFLHSNYCNDIPKLLTDFPIQIKETGVVVFFSGGGIQPSMEKEVKNAREKSGMDKSVFVYRPAFDEFAKEGLKNFCQNIGRKIELNESFLPDELGWAGISEHAHRQYACKILGALLPVAFNGSGRFEIAKNYQKKLKSLQENLKLDYNNEELNEVWSNCQKLFDKFSEPAYFTRVDLIQLRNLMLGDSSIKGLVDLIENGWTKTAI